MAGGGEATGGALATGGTTAVSVGGFRTTEVIGGGLPTGGSGRAEFVVSPPETSVAMPKTPATAPTPIRPYPMILALVGPVDGSPEVISATRFPVVGRPARAAEPPAPCAAV